MLFDLQVQTVGACLPINTDTRNQNRERFVTQMLKTYVQTAHADSYQQTFQAGRSDHSNHEGLGRTSPAFAFKQHRKILRGAWAAESLHDLLYKC